jgi:hypothetical protein
MEKIEDERGRDKSTVHTLVVMRVMLFSVSNGYIKSRQTLEGVFQALSQFKMFSLITIQRSNHVFVPFILPPVFTLFKF